MAEQAKNNTNWIYALSYNKLVDYCEEVLHCTIEESYAQDDEANLLTREIIINARNSPEKKLYSLLHEAGHILESKGKNYTKKYSTANESYDARKLSHRVDTVEEEYAAWEKGYDLAKRLKLNINKENFYKDKCECLFSWFKWAAKKSRHQQKSK